MRTVFALLFAAVLAASWGAPALADEGGGSDPDTFIVSLRARWWVPTVDGSFQINQHDYEGSYADYQDELDMEAFDPRNNPGVPELVLQARLKGSGIIGTWVETSMQGDSWIERLEFNGRTFENEHLLTELDFRLYRLTYINHLLDAGFLKLAPMVGVGYLDYRAEVIPDPPDPPTHTGGNAPFPYIGGQALFRPPVDYLDYFEVVGEVTWSRGDWGDARLLYLEGYLGLSLRPIKFVSLGGGFRFFHLYADAINVWSDDPDTILVTMGGPYFELEARF